MYDELIIERALLKIHIRTCMVHLMETTDREERIKTLTIMNDLAKRVEKINCKLVHKELIDLFKRD